MSTERGTDLNHRYVVYMIYGSTETYNSVLCVCSHVGTIIILAVNVEPFGGDPLLEYSLWHTNTAQIKTTQCSNFDAYAVESIVRWPMRLSSHSQGASSFTRAGTLTNHEEAWYRCDKWVCQRFYLQTLLRDLHTALVGQNYCLRRGAGLGSAIAS